MSREQTLADELEHLKSLNSAVETLLQTVKKALGDVQATKKASENASSLIEDWVKILNQAKFTSTALKDPLWLGPDEPSSNKELQLQEARLRAELQAIEAENEALAQDRSPTRKRRR